MTHRIRLVDVAAPEARQTPRALARLHSLFNHVTLKDEPATVASTDAMNVRLHQGCARYISAAIDSEVLKSRTD